MSDLSIFSAFPWRGKTFPSRVVFAPINPGFARNGRPTARLLRFQRERAGPAIGLSYVGNVAITVIGRSNRSTPVLETGADSKRYAVLCRAIKRAGSLAGIQLAVAPSELQPKRHWRADDIVGEVCRLRQLLEALSSAEVRSMLSRFVSATAEARRAGFDVIQIHAAHGYALALLLDGAFNSRTGYFAADGVWLDDFARQLRVAAGNALISVRLNVESGLRDAATDHASAARLALRLTRSGVDMIDLSAGFYTVDRRMIYPAARGVMPYLGVARALANEVQQPVVFAGGVHDLRVLPPELPRNLFVGIGRALIADPLFAEKARRGEHRATTWCARTNRCHYFSAGRDGITCGVNDRI